MGLQTVLRVCVSLRLLLMTLATSHRLQTPTTTPAPPAGQVTSGELLPQQLLANQCSLGTSSSPPQGTTRKMLLYVNTGATVPCTGVVIGWEICFFVDEGPPPRNSHEGAVDIVVLRQNQSLDGYQIVNICEITLQGNPEERQNLQCNRQNLQCRLIDTTDTTSAPLSMVKGDILGFTNKGSTQIATFSANGTLNGSNLRQLHQVMLQVNNSISLEQLLEVNAESATPLIRVILSMSLGLMGYV